MAAVPCLSGSSDTDPLIEVLDERIDEELDAPRLADHDFSAAALAYPYLPINALSLLE
jgi:hypothetical protein